MRKILLLLLVALSTITALGQNSGIIKGRVYNLKNNEPIPFVNIVIWGTNIGTVSDFEGEFIFTGLQPGFAEVSASSIGFKPYVSPELRVTNAATTNLDIGMEETSIAIQEVTVRGSAFRKSEESPVSLQRIGISEIEKAPGANRDISKVIQSFPGVSSSASFRNDVIVRGGGPNENRFYLDGVEIPTINHFSTQGSSGGPVGIINVDFVREVNFYSGAFPANKGNALSSILDFRLVDGNRDRLKVKGILGASDLGITLDGPISERTTFIVSARRSYLQFLFNIIGLPFLPTYNDLQFKVKTRIDSKNEIVFLGLGALDQFKLNTGIKNPTEDQQFLLKTLPINEQWNYTVGVVYKHYRANGTDTWVVSRSFLNNTAYKYNNNDNNSYKILDYSSTEAENKLRYEYDRQTLSGIKINAGALGEYVDYSNQTYRLIASGNGSGVDDYNRTLTYLKWGLFGQVTKSVWDDKLSLSLGLRSDANSYSTEMNNLLRQISPRFSASYSLTDNWVLNFNTGRYYMQPSNTSLGFADQNGTLVNKANGLKYIASNHLVAGVEYNPNDASKITAEAFYKTYSNYPFSLSDSVAISSKGADFGTFGDEALRSIGKGRSYGLELLYRTKNLMGINAIIAYTLVWSEVHKTDKNLESTGGYNPTAWDNRNLITLTATREFRKGWEVGVRWRYLGGAPYTPYDLERSALVDVWDTQNRPYLNYGKFNTLRYKAFHQLDVRIDKSYFFKKWSLNCYLDIQNLYNFKSEQQSNYLSAGVNASDPTRYNLKEIPSDGSGTVLPTIGIIVEF
ncbi:TonB-dependent receptor [Williamwhitmania taraxaci]|uniref:TonB-dependent Receptor Plug Domain n=1 Tax=Williamwhitmania taraxaci TaxID=1640674 RepID=A0A1G6GHE3_9BACT|nr:TonB-dependent receptor [Williamwhitmania taraxaci]SDB81360.1 TonB-dependent Receptor Plug Domain [Williamwhitmania taraxaci]